MSRIVLQFTAWLHLNGYSESSIQNHRLDLIRFLDWLGEQGANDLEALQGLDAETLLSYRQHLSGRLKPRSVNRHLSTLRLFFRHLEEAGQVARNPAEQIVFVKTLPDLPELLLPGEVSALLDAPDEAHYLGLRDRAMLELLYATGLKLNELIALDVADLELDMAFVRVRGRRQRMVPLTDRAVALLRRYLAETRPGRVRSPADPCLFPGRNGTRITRVGVWKLIKKHARAAGIEKNFSPRTLRHAFAMHLILGGMDLDAIKFLFGYKKLEAAALYAHVNTPDYREAYRAYHPLAGGEQG